MATRPAVAPLPRMPRAVGMSLGPGGRGPHGFYGPGGDLVGLAEATGEGWWWITAGRDEALARLAPTRAELLGPDGTELGTLEWMGPDGRSRLRRREDVWEVDRLRHDGAGRHPIRARVRRRGVDVVRLDERRGVVAVVAVVGLDALDPRLGVFAAVAVAQAWSRRTDGVDVATEAMGLASTALRMGWPF